MPVVRTLARPLQCAVLALAAIAAMLACAAEPLPQALRNSQFELKLDAGAIVSLKSTRDGFHTEYVQPGARLGDVAIRYRQPGGDWRSVHTAALTNEAVFSSSADPAGCSVLYHITNGPSEALVLQLRFGLEEQAVGWTLKLQNA